jgi:hypothetical protein
MRQQKPDPIRSEAGRLYENDKRIGHKPLRLKLLKSLVQGISTFVRYHINSGDKGVTLLAHPILFQSIDNSLKSSVPHFRIDEGRRYAMRGFA